MSVEISIFCSSAKLKMAAGKAQIGKPAPDFTAKAVMPDGQFSDLKLSSYRGTPPPWPRFDDSLNDIDLLCYPTNH